MSEGGWWGVFSFLRASCLLPPFFFEFFLICGFFKFIFNWRIIALNLLHILADES